MTNETNLLKVGDRIYREGNDNRITAVIIIERLTKTQAISKDGKYKFDIKLSNYYKTARLIGEDTWSNCTYCLETPELQEKLFRQVVIEKIKKFDYSELSTEQLTKLTSILDISYKF